jgi:hypothetical protein
MLRTLSRSLLVAVIISAPTQAADAGQRARAGRANPPEIAADDMRMNPAEVMRILDGYALVQAQESLQLSEAQYGRFVTRLKNLQDVRRRNLQARHRIVQELRRLAGPQAPAKPDDNSVRQQLKALRDHEERAAGEIRTAYDALDEVLDARQQARFRLFEERLELRKMDLLMRARQGAARRQER